MAIPATPSSPRVMEFRPDGVKLNVAMTAGTTSIEVGYGLDFDAPTKIVKFGISGIADVFNVPRPASIYYFWARNRNASGVSPWSKKIKVQLPASALVRWNGVWTKAIVWVYDGTAKKWKMASPYVLKAGVWTPTGPAGKVLDAGNGGTFVHTY